MEESHVHEKKAGKAPGRTKRDKREILFSILGASILFGTFVFKEVLLDPLKEGMSEARTLIAQYELTSDVLQMGGSADFSPPEKPDDESDATLNRISDEDDKQEAAYKVSKNLEQELPKEIVGAKLMTQLSQANDKVFKSVQFEKTRAVYLWLSLQADPKDEKIARKRQQATASQLSDVRDQVVLIKESIQAHKWKVTLYTYCTWTLFAIGLTLAVIGKIFHIPGLESAAGG
jgi:hypothetical protein